MVGVGIELDILSNWDKLKYKFQTIWGLVSIIILLVLIYYRCLDFINNRIYTDLYQELKGKEYWINIIVPVIIIWLTTMIWLNLTNRFFIRLTNKITVGIIINNTEEEIDKRNIFKLVQRVIEYINYSIHFRDLKLYLLPINFCKSKTELTKYHEKFGFMYDVLIGLDLYGGKFSSVEKIQIQYFNITFKPKSRTKKIFEDEINLAQDMQIPLIDKNWEYETNNSGIDKIKYFDNIQYIFLYYIGLYSIYVDKYEVALDLLEPLYNAKDSEILISIQKDKKFSLKLRPNNIVSGRLGTILANLFFTVAIKSHLKLDSKKALGYLKMLEGKLSKHSNRFVQYINMSRYNYELDNLIEARRYTNLANSLRPNSIEVNLNYSFFAIIEDDAKTLSQRFRSLFAIRFERTFVNWLDVLEFYKKEKDKNHLNSYLLDFAYAFIEYVFVDQTNPSILKNICEGLLLQLKYEDLRLLGENVLQNGSNKRIRRNKRK